VAIELKGYNTIRTRGDVVQGNFLGTDISGTKDTNQPVDFDSSSGGPSGRGVFVTLGSGYNIIGTNGDGNDDLGERNLISGNSRGVTLFGTSDPNDPATGYNLVAGNFMGTDASGMNAIPNWAGVNAGVGSHDDIIGVRPGDPGSAAEGNLISGN